MSKNFIKSFLNTISVKYVSPKLANAGEAILLLSHPSFMPIDIAFIIAAYISGDSYLNIAPSVSGSFHNSYTPILPRVLAI